jgi:hypothetical protein
MLLYTVIFLSTVDLQVDSYFVVPNLVSWHGRQQRQHHQRQPTLHSTTGRRINRRHGTSTKLSLSASPRNNKHNYNGNGNKPEFTAALAIVPPIKDWDRLQRARHYARDPAFHEWPPAIRLFHPFSSSSAFDVAQVVEDLEIEPFEVTLDTWVIVPHIEALKKEFERQQAIPDIIHGEEDSEFEIHERESEKKIQELIASEEKAATEKARFKKMGKTKPDDNENAIFEKKSLAQLRDEQKRTIEEDFGGPCILCLEPDEESKQKIIDLRESLREGLNYDSYSSPSSLYSWSLVKEVDMGYRPLIPISKFDSFQSAIDVARRLKGLWGEPLTIAVRELHILSCKPDEDNLSDKWEIANEHSAQSLLEWKSEAWGCNAKVMLVGEEEEQDEAVNAEMVQKLLEIGEPGGMDISSDYTILDDEDESTSDIERFLDDDEDFDEGSQVIIGRTHFYTGDQRTYKGMPATSVMDAKDRFLGEAGAVSGSARRRGATSRQGSGWDEGEFGRRQKDFSPWGLRERGAKDKFSNLPDVEFEDEYDNPDFH